jgi:uncharacterized protein (DUF1015 family)
MARIYPFRAVRYNTMDVAMGDVVTQPYDKITPSMQQAYYAHSPYNLVRLILGLPELFDVPGENDVYTRAKRDFDEWREKGVLYRENEPCIFAYAQSFTVPGTNEVKMRRGFIALGEVQEYAQGVIFRHEQTLDKPKHDRMQLLQATRAHFGQIFMLYSDPALTVERTLFGSSFRAEIEITDEYGVLHQLARVAEPGTINILAGAMADKKLIIADGHHRYETALAYSKEHSPAQVRHQERNLSNSLPQPPYPEAAVMMTFVNMDSDGLVILPTHRVVNGLRNFNSETFLQKAETFFTIRSLFSGDLETDMRELATAGLSGTAFVAVTAQGLYLLTAKEEVVWQALPNVSERQRQLDVVQLHALVLEQLLGISPEAIREQEHLRYVRDPHDALKDVVSGRADIAFLLNPCTLDQLREIAFAGETMPQKSTDFYPKLLSGLAIYALD